MKLYTWTNHLLMPGSETEPIDFDWQGHSWSFRPAEVTQPHSGEYLVQKYPSHAPIPMNFPRLCHYLGITPPNEPVPLRTIATFLELTAKISPLPLSTILYEANLLRH